MHKSYQFILDDNRMFIVQDLGNHHPPFTPVVVQPTGATLLGLIYTKGILAIRFAEVSNGRA